MPQDGYSQEALGVGHRTRHGFPSTKMEGKCALVDTSGFSIANHRIMVVIVEVEDSPPSSVEGERKLKLRREAKVTWRV